MEMVSSWRLSAIGEQENPIVSLAVAGTTGMPLDAELAGHIDVQVEEGADEEDEPRESRLSERVSWSTQRPKKRSTLNVFAQQQAEELEAGGIEAFGVAEGTGAAGAVERGRRPRALVKKRSASIASMI